MQLSRKHRKELRRLRGEAQDLLDQQRVVIGRANDVLQKAGKQARALGDDYVAPRIDEALEGVRPVIDRGVASARRAAANVRVATAPYVTRGLQRVIRALDDADNHDAAKQVRAFGVSKGYLKKDRSPGGIIALGIGIAAAAGVAYAVWSAFRTDDELWIVPEVNSAPSES